MDIARSPIWPAPFASKTTTVLNVLSDWPIVCQISPKSSKLINSNGFLSCSLVDRSVKHIIITRIVLHAICERSPDEYTYCRQMDVIRSSMAIVNRDRAVHGRRNSGRGRIKCRFHDLFDCVNGVLM
uniref:Uncharacterized protein n=1 Tax=Spongospora subterranea TaxID=70186 RepID=A0A0H5QLX4_9EUKA|eukprot:CRZ02332.1 hypothetical protein [Spongospora subterranea]